MRKDSTADNVLTPRVLREYALVADGERGGYGDVWTGCSGALRFRWTGAGKARLANGGLAVALRLEPGEHHDLVLEISDRDLPDERPDPDRLWAATEELWSEVAPDCGDLIAVANARHPER